MPRNKQKTIKIEIVSPIAEQVFKLKTFPIETDNIIFQAKVFQDNIEITNKVKINWKIKLSWTTNYNTYQTLKEIADNSLKIQFETGGILRIRAAVVIDGKESSARVKVNIIGTNPSKEQIINLLDNDIIKAIAWEESTWSQFDVTGQPLLPMVSKGKRIPAMRGLFQISEYWWGRDKRIKHIDHNRVAWQWVYNIETAKEILALLYKLVIANYPDESNERQWNRAIKAFTVGENSIYTKQIPDDFWYVIKVRKAIKEKEWRKK
ncbi:hypothetical protein A2230_07095 [candidate division WOR-1 bacterium RIFOXYA2_FULL_36_21]|uniref:Transglycosylase SLT domain-containing protein n=1 Tax=candidate division WOR-1 bacterium RIFOXYB2_FULL_36_35 TaxID=1802578 RepID=A0A1F4S8N8_UNCSA|nr:MAG: hypothetical protein A2230_07095 [candidate division WOR-1 bacterium RIFOXYA2_FULL_36_21]OGC16774.1 MAG: hypothetical protein A2290_00250 [candidate division WOR-1 bacterium RIFOXYB2_FULL_36_35]OGC19742.1 MAG: hypothetical protein A2282_08935 [candidate division WOR-1 bacterium RIFOXYA12_FULL_36_13]